MHILKLSFVCLLFFGSLNGQQLPNSESEELKVLESILSNSNNSTTYYKTIIEDQKTPLTTYIEAYLLKFYLCTNDIDSASVIISDEEVNLLRQKFSKQKVKRIDKLLPKYKNRTTKKHERYKTGSISMPVTFRDGTMALYFSLSTYSGEFNLLRKKNDTWEKVCSNAVWIE